MPRYGLSVAALLSVVALLSACGESQQVQESVRPALVTQPSVAGAQLETFPGEVRARFEPELAFRIAGKVSKRLVEVGQHVKKDQALAELDPQDVRLQLEAARAQVVAAEANLKTLSAELERYKTLTGRNLVSRSQYENIENQYRAAQARVSQVRAEYDVARNQTGYAVLRAPQDGVIARRALEVGQVVAAGQTVFTLAADGEREVLISLPEQGIKRFSVDMPVEVELWSQPNERLAGHIRELAPAADSQSRTFAARVAFSEAEVGAELGQSARVLIGSSDKQALAVPLSALSAEQSQAFVWVVKDDGVLERRYVEVGAFGDSHVPVFAGLEPDEWVVTAGVQVLREGQKVRPVDRANRTVKAADKE